MDEAHVTASGPAPPATRGAALQRLDGFVPLAGARYAARRNFDAGPGRHDNVSGLSPWIRRRLITEAEVLRAVVAAHPPEAAEKFLREVLWRSYWKGWLALRPAVWQQYAEALERLQSEAAKDGPLRRRLEAAESGATGIDGFDAWARELRETGYLHNHARMWFASIWIFTLRLPWQLGADFFFRHLLDGDPASNTLSWRWVAGLHTRGKHYLARAANIRRYTGGRHEPSRQLDEDAAPLAWSEPPAPRTPEFRPEPGRGGRTGLLILGDDCRGEASPAGQQEIAAVAAGWSRRLQARWRLAEPVAAFGREALADGLARAAGHAGTPATALDEERWTESVVDWARTAGVSRVVALKPAVGPWQDAANRAEAALAEVGISLAWSTRAWDRDLWPRATRGFFAFRKAARPVLANLHRYD